MLAQTMYDYIYTYDYDTFWNIEKTYMNKSATVRLIFQNGGESVDVQHFYSGAWHSGTVYHYERDESGWDIYYMYQTAPGAVFRNYLYVKKDKSFIRHEMNSEYSAFGNENLKSGYKLAE